MPQLRSPAEFYIKGLLVHPDAFSDEQVAERLQDLGLIYFSEKFIGRLRRKVPAPPEPFYPEDSRHLPSYRYLVREGINSMFLSSLPMKMAMGILDRPKAREFVESMLTLEAAPAAIVAYVFKHLKVHCNPEAVELYKHYFWNTDLLDNTEMRIATQLHTQLMSTQFPELEGHQRLLNSAMGKDARKVAADLPHSVSTAILVQSRLGVSPAPHELAARLRETCSMNILRALEASHQDGPGDSKKQLEYLGGARMGEELLQMIQHPEDQMRDQVATIGLRTDTSEVISIHQLGTYTVDMSPPTKDADHADDAQVPAAIPPDVGK